MAKYNDIVGWFYRNGKRIPIRAKKDSSESAKKRAEDVLNHRLGEGENYRRVESVGLSGKVNYKTDIRVPVYTDPDTGVTEYDTETEYNSTKLPLRAGKGKDTLRKNVNARGAKNKKLTWSEKYERDNRRKLMKERGVTNWKDVPDYLKQSTGSQTPGSTESLYGTSKKKTKKH